MRTLLFSLAIAAPIVLLPCVGSAKGCLKGAAVGGVVGHVAGHHAVAGAAAGCLIGHQRAKVKDGHTSRAPATPQPGLKPGVSGHTSASMSCPTVDSRKLFRKNLVESPWRRLRG